MWVYNSTTQLTTHHINKLWQSCDKKYDPTLLYKNINNYGQKIIKSEYIENFTLP